MRTSRGRRILLEQFAQAHGAHGSPGDDRDELMRQVVERARDRLQVLTQVVVAKELQHPVHGARLF
jgi:hypothetical protein